MCSIFSCCELCFIHRYTIDKFTLFIFYSGNRFSNAKHDLNERASDKTYYTLEHLTNTIQCN